MISSLGNPLLILLVISSIFVLPAAGQGNPSVSVGDSLLANDDNLTWQSPSVDFAFGFRQVPDEQDRFLLAIWFDKIQNKTIVWSANVTVEKGSWVELTNDGLVLRAPSGVEQWRSNIKGDGGTGVSNASMLDNGNFVIKNRNSGNLWESFKDPTDTLLPGQVLRNDSMLSSALSPTSYKRGKFQLRFSSGSLVLNQIDVFNKKPFNHYFNITNGVSLIFNESGYIQIEDSSGNKTNIAPTTAAPGKDSYYRATLDFDGVFTLYSHSKISNGDEDWSSWWHALNGQGKDICSSFWNAPDLGSGPCGYNSICHTDQNGRAICECPLGFSFLDVKNPHYGCRPDYQSYPGDCNEDGSTTKDYRLDFKSMRFVDWPASDYETLNRVNETDCWKSCLLDCTCAVAILEEPELSNGIGRCWKKKLPLSNGRKDNENINRKVLIKTLISNESFNPASTPNPDKEKQNQPVLILAVLLGTSAFFNIFTVAVFSLILFFFYQRKLQELSRIGTKGENEMNLHSFTYNELEEATKGFKEELGKGASGTVYKGELSRTYVAVKKLDNILQEREKEFKTEVNVIGQTHHRNLVRLLGYCDEAEHQLLVFELMQNGSLASFLFGALRPSWQQRLQIASGIARGLRYLHEECSTQIIHCDIKPQNILLDDSFTAKISDFGLAKLLMNSKSRTLTGIRGTKGYVAPEWFRSVPVTVKVDVYSFGVMLLEIVCCRRCVRFEMEEAAILTEWAYDCYIEGMLDKLVENDEEARNNMGRVETLVKVAMWCVQEEPSQRPSMRAVTMMLEGAVLVPAPPCPFPYSSKSHHSLT
ncbi:hypothetical protein SLEP1_g46689 [Rubroshorea leprosula]|uniref:Receptor-like serine/threonine-protein kinase n=1 Tax=Rubroshorea leprosula TaxID=152421 RepID=A0AAV5LN33_9ROSI|nr:hypothetical protein SLEP1_g46689 [Rubroshorea leprosula]